MACQDMMFSKRWLDIGGQLWIDPMVKVGHWGMECHDGDLDGHLRGQKALADAAPAFAAVKQMAAELRARAA